VPKIAFAGTSVQQAGPIAIPAAAILVFIAFLIVMLWFAGNSDPKTERARRRAVQEVIEKLKDAVRPRPAPPPPEQKPEPKPSPKLEPKPEPKPGPTVDPIPPRPDEPLALYPLCWSPLLPPPAGQRIFVRAFKEERDLNEQKQQRIQTEWREKIDPGFVAKDYHVHHIIPLFLGGEDNLKTNGKLHPATTHLRGHADLAKQPQMLAPPPPLPPLPENLYAHKPGTKYIFVGFKGQGICPKGLYL
jgi:hypothetical protein